MVTMNNPGLEVLVKDYRYVLSNYFWFHLKYYCHYNVCHCELCQWIPYSEWML